MGWRWPDSRRLAGRKLVAGGSRVAVAAYSHSNSVGRRVAGGGPAGVGVGLEEAEVADGGLGEVVEGLPAVEGVDAPAGVGLAGRGCQ